MRRGNIFILILALVMGGVAAFMARSWILAQANTAPAAPMSTIVVAAAAVGYGTVLSSDNVMEIPWASSSVPEGTFATRDLLLKEGRRVVLTPMERNEFILQQKITGPGQRASLSALLDAGKRAVTVRVDDVRGVAGFVMPGDRVDVVLIRAKNEGTGAVERFSDVLLQNVKVLAVDQLANERQEKATVAKAVTLEVETDQAQKILLATDIGKLSLILRQAGEGHASQAPRITERDLFFEAPKEPAAVVPVPAIARGPATSKVEIVRGMKIQEYSVMRGK